MTDNTANRRTLVAITGAVIATAAIGITAAVVAADRQHDEPVAFVEAAAAAPDGWRWESYGAVQLLVPAGWVYGGDPSQWCVGRTRPEPFVTRPGVHTLAGCPEVPDLAQRTSYVEFAGLKASVTRFDHQWVRETRMFGGTGVTVFSADAELRSRIFASVKVIAGTDVFGCTPQHPSSADRDVRPPDRGGLGSVGEIRRVSVCGYSIGDGAGLFSGRTFTGDDATALVDAVRTAPTGTGPDDAPSHCLPDELGERLYVLRVHGSEHDQDVIVRYAGCDHNGTDDGTTRRQLTADVVGPLLTGSDRAGVVLTDRIGRWLR